MPDQIAFERINDGCSDDLPELCRPYVARPHRATSKHSLRPVDGVTESVAGSGREQPCLYVCGAFPFGAGARSGNGRICDCTNLVRPHGHCYWPDTVYAARPRKYVELCLVLAN